MSHRLANDYRSTGSAPRPNKPTPPDLPSVVQYLIENLGARLTAFIASTEEACLDEKWLSDKAAAEANAERKLRAAFEIFQMVQAVESPHTVRAWFIGMNPQLEQLSPAEAIEAGQIREAKAAARAFITGG